MGSLNGENELWTLVLRNRVSVFSVYFRVPEGGYDLNCKEERCW